MFGRSKSSQIKLASEALRGGRLDEAFRLATASATIDSAEARRVLADLCEPLLRRAQEHLIAERFTEALCDIDRAARCGVNQHKVEDWRQRALSAMQDRQREKREQQQVIEAARERLEAGDLTLARDHLADAPSNHAADELAQRAERQRERAAHEISEAKAAIGRDDFGTAIRCVISARRLHVGNDDLAAVEDAVCDAVFANARACLATGRLDRVSESVREMAELGRNRPERSDLEQVLSLAGQALESFRRAAYREADILLSRMAQIIPDAAWISANREFLRNMAEHHAAISSGPLGFLPAGRPGHSPGVLDQTMTHRPTSAPPPVISPVATSQRLLLRIDGIGSYLLYRGDRVSIGRAGPGATADLPIVSDLPENAAQILRSGDDYFLLASDATVDGQATRQALLSHNDRIGLGRRVRMTFLRPSRKSASAVLELGSGLRAVADVRSAILFNGPVILGGSDAHVAIPGVSLVLSDRGGQLAVRQLAPGGGGVGPSVALALGSPVELAGVRLSVQVWNPTPAIGQVVG